jgi:hypothetical protein
VDSYDFGSLSYGELAQTTILLSNPGSEDLDISSITVDPPFEVSPASLKVVGKGSSPITVFVQPTTYDSFSSPLTIVADDADIGTVTIPLTAVTITDEDGDGYDAIAAGGDDCDDESTGSTEAATVHPGAEEVWYDGIDENCDGLNDYDQDADGYDAETDDHEVSEGMADCNDRDTSFHPGAEDTPYDNRDSNCDGADDWDYDGDGYESLAYGRGSDCDDFDARVNKNGIENLDGKDDDCDGYVDNDALAEGSKYIYDADGDWDRTGYAVAVGDLSGDGIAEVVVGAPYVDATNSSASGRGGVAVFDGPDLLATGTTINRADNFFDGDGNADLLGSYVTILGDYDGDGVDDLAVSATGTSSGAGTVYVIGGDDARHGDAGDAMASYTGLTSSAFGRGIGTDIDLDADGMADLVTLYTSGGYNCVGLEYGSSSPDSGSITTMDAKWSTDGSEIAFYRNAPVGGDLDGDGYTDLVLSDGMADYGISDSGAMWVVWGQSTQYFASSTADIEGTATTVAFGTSSGDHDAWSTQMGADWDADGDDELWIYNAGEALYVVEGGPTRRYIFDPATSAAVTYTWSSGWTDAEMIRQTGDWDGDGVSDMLVFLENTTGYYGSSVLFGTDIRTGTYTDEEGSVGTLVGDTTYGNGNVGYGMAPKGADIDGDGDADTVVGDPDFNSRAGEAYVLISGLVSE